MIWYDQWYLIFELYEMVWQMIQIQMILLKNHYSKLQIQGHSKFKSATVKANNAIADLLTIFRKDTKASRSPHGTAWNRGGLPWACQKHILNSALHFRVCN